MNSLVRRYVDKKVEELKVAKDADIVAIKEADEGYKALRGVVYGLRNRREVADLSGYKFSDEINAKIAERKAKFNADVNAVYDEATEIESVLALADTDEQRTQILKNYNVM